MLNIQKQKQQLEKALKAGGLTPDERIDLVEELQAMQDEIAEFMEAMAEVPDLLDEPEGVATDTIPANSPMIIKKYRKG